MAQLALAWCLRQPNVSSVIIGASKPSQVEDNAGASGVTLAQTRSNPLKRRLHKQVFRNRLLLRAVQAIMHLSNTRIPERLNT